VNNDYRVPEQVEQYIAYKQGLGYELRIEAAELRRFANYVRAQNYMGSLTVNLALNWAAEKPHYTRWYKARRLETIHCFAKYAYAIDDKTQIPPTGIFGKCHGRVVPYIYSDDEVILLMKQADRLLSPDGLRAKAVTTAIGLLWSTGLRVCELCRLSRDDVHLNNHELHIRDTKFHKERYVPIHPSVTNALKRYANLRDHLYPNSSDSHFFLSTHGKLLSERNLEYSFTVLRSYLLSSRKSRWDRRPPRLYDLRHTFACNTIIRWFKEHADINHHIYLLSTYLGHVKPSDTYWYLTGTSELMALSTERFEKFVFELDWRENNEK